MKNKIILITVFFSFFINLYAAQNDIASAQTAPEFIPSTNDYEEVVYEHLKENEKKTRKITYAHKKDLFYANASNSTNNKENSANTKEQSKADTQKNPKKFFLSGYCYGSNKEIEISRLSSYMYLRCNFQSVDAQLATLLVPDAFSKALIGKPLYVKVGNKRYNVLGGVILNHDRTSLNLAYIVNDRKIESFLAETGVSTADIATKQAQAYLDAKIASKNVQTVSYTTGATSDNTTTTNTTLPPDKDDYITAGGIQLVSAMVEAGSKLFKEDLPYLFKTRANAIYYADIVVTDADAQLPNVSIADSTLTKNPTFEESKKKSNITLGGEKVVK